MIGNLDSAHQGHRNAVRSLCFAPDGVLYSGDSRGWLARWDTFGCTWRTRICRRGITAVCGAGPYGIAIGGFDGTVMSLTGSNAEPRHFSRMRRGISSLSFDETRDRLIATSFRGDVVAFDSELGRLSEPWEEERGPAFAALDADCSVLFVWGMGRRVELRSAGNLEVIDYITLPSLMVHDVMPHVGATCLTVDYEHRLSIWLTEGWVRLGEIDLDLHGRVRFVGSAAGLLWLRSTDSVMSVDLSRLGIVHVAEMPGMAAADIDETGERIALGFEDGEIQVWSVDKPGITKN